MTLAIKSWFEVRRRLLVGLPAWIFVLLMLWFVGLRDNTAHAARDHARQAIEAIGMVEAIMAMVFSALLAGSGVITQSCSRSSARMPESMLFTLSLPVRRRSVLATRAALGALGALLLVLLFWTLLPLFLRSLPGSPPLHVLAGALPFQLIAAALAYSVGLLGTCLVSETVLGYVFGFGGGLCGMAAGLQWRPLTRFLKFASGATYMTSGQINWTGLAVCVALSCLFVVSAVRVIERRQF